MPKFIDLTGQKFNRLTVLERADTINKRTRWRCVCDCGNICIVDAPQLKNGHTKSCGCMNDENKRRYEDLIGKRFGRLTVIRRKENYVSPSGKRTDLRWECLCDCGNYCIVNGQSLKNNRTKSCGCYQKENLNRIGKHGRYKTNEYKVVGNVVYIDIDNSDEKALCDVDDWEYLKNYYWRINSNGYVTVGNGKIKMHKIIMPDNKYNVVDHINRNKLDNRKCNLRYTTYKVNAQNRTVSSISKSGHIGVYKVKNRWVSWIGHDGKGEYLGSFKTIEDAIKSREDAEKIYHKEKFVN